MRRETTKQLLIGTAAVCLIAGSAFSVYRTQFAALKFNLALHQAIGRALAEETARALSHTGKLVTIAVELGHLPELKAQLDEFERTLRAYPHLTILHKYQLETDDKPKFSFGSGLSGRRFVRIVNKNLTADAFVSFVGAPGLSKDELAELKKQPVLIAEARSPDKLKRLFDEKILHAAVVSRFTFPTPVKGQPRTPQEWFDQRCQLVTAQNASILPETPGDP
jgi:hypothetical protein